MKVWYHPTGRFSGVKKGETQPDRFDVICETWTDQLEVKQMINAGLLAIWRDDAAVAKFVCINDQASMVRLYSLIELIENNV